MNLKDSQKEGKVCIDSLEMTNFRLKADNWNFVGKKRNENAVCVNFLDNSSMILRNFYQYFSNFYDSSDWQKQELDKVFRLLYFDKGRARTCRISKFICDFFLQKMIPGNAGLAWKK